MKINKYPCVSEHESRHECPWQDVCRYANHSCIKTHRCSFGTESVTWYEFSKNSRPAAQRAGFIVKQRDKNAKYNARSWLGVKYYYDDVDDFFEIFLVNELGKDLLLIGDSKALRSQGWHFLDLP